METPRAILAGLLKPAILSKPLLLFILLVSQLSFGRHHSVLAALILTLPLQTSMVQYHCTEKDCGQTFPKKGGLDTHRRNFHQTHIDYLNVRIPRLSGEHSWQCPWCGIFYDVTTSLSNHIRTSHKDPDGQFALIIPSQSTYTSLLQNH